MIELGYGTSSGSMVPVVHSCMVPTYVHTLATYVSRRAEKLDKRLESHRQKGQPLEAIFILIQYMFLYLCNSRHLLWARAHRLKCSPKNP